MRRDCRLVALVLSREQLSACSIQGLKYRRSMPLAWSLPNQLLTTRMTRVSWTSPIQSGVARWATLQDLVRVPVSCEVTVFNRLPSIPQVFEISVAGVVSSIHTLKAYGLSVCFSILCSTRWRIQPG